MTDTLLFWKCTRNIDEQRRAQLAEPATVDKVIERALSEAENVTVRPKPGRDPNLRSAL